MHQKFGWPRSGSYRRLLVIVGLVFVIHGKGIDVAEGQQTYKLPSPSVVDIIDAPPVPGVSLSPDRKHMLLIDRASMPGIEDISRRMLKLAGMRVDPIAEGRFTTNFDQGLSIRKLLGGEVVPVGLPAPVKISNISWSHKSTHFVVMTLGEKGQQLWLVDIADPSNPKKLTDAVSTVLGGVDWTPDGQGIICQLVPENRGPEPTIRSTPIGPNVQESYGNESPVRTYQDLLTNADDEALFKHYATTQLAIIDLEGEIRRLGQPAIYANTQISPDGQHLLITRIEPPFSYQLTYSGFPKRVDVVDLNGEIVHHVAEIPMAENIPIEGVPTGPRSITWKPGDGSTLYWMEALDGGDPNLKADFRDRLMCQAFPFDDPNGPTELLKTEHRGVGFSVMQDPNFIVVTDYDRDRRWVRSLQHDLRDLEKASVALVDRNIRDRYNDPGSLVSVPDEAGFSRILQVGNFVFRIGAGASPDGDFPFVDRQDLTTMQTERLWQSAAGVYETPVTLLPDVSSVSTNSSVNANAKPGLITSRESTTEPSNLVFYDLESDRTVALTEFQDPSPQIRGIRKELVTYQRRDGVNLSATLYLPADYREGDKLPLIVWAYPMEFSDASTAGQVSGNPHRFVRMSGITHLTLVTQGYAVMDNATMPIIGDPETMNDTFVQQIVDSAKAAIDFAVERGVADRNRVGVGGHSYGAFMTANLLAHCDLFHAGVARSGAYNRTLTPFGFQAERRDYWNAREIYINLSPFNFANQIKTPLLLIHGEDDNNPGTFPIQSQRMFQAIKGNGGFTRLVMLPYESHGYQARESVLHCQAEMIEWFDRYLKPK